VDFKIGDKVIMNDLAVKYVITHPGVLCEILDIHNPMYSTAGQFLVKVLFPEEYAKFEGAGRGYPVDRKACSPFHGAKLEKIIYNIRD
jgi:hypothetical protein